MTRCLQHTLIVGSWLPRSVYVQRVTTVKQSGPRSSLGRWAPAEDEDHKIVGPWSCLGKWRALMPIMYLFWWLCVYSSDQTGHKKILIFKLDLTSKVKIHRPPKTEGILTKVFCIVCANFVVLVWTGDKLWRGQARGWHTQYHTHTHMGRQTDRQTDNRQTDRQIERWRDRQTDRQAKTDLMEQHKDYDSNYFIW